MGTWGTGNFSSDTAADFLGELTGRAISEIAETMAADPVVLEPDEYWGVVVPCLVELLCLVGEQKHVGVRLPGADTVAGWKAHFLGVYDATIDGLDPEPGFKEARRRVLADTFDRLTALTGPTE
jgi:hypothetical protein